MIFTQKPLVPSSAVTDLDANDWVAPAGCRTLDSVYFVASFSRGATDIKQLHYNPTLQQMCVTHKSAILPSTVQPFQKWDYGEKLQTQRVSLFAQGLLSNKARMTMFTQKVQRAESAPQVDCLPLPRTVAHTRTWHGITAVVSWLGSR